jgi:energy-coupling factor transport system ATP-binding protein
MNGSVPYIETRNVNFKYDRSEFEIKDLNIKLYKEDFTALTGENGCGKTTAGKLFTGILKPRSGSVLLKGSDIDGMDLGEIGKEIGYLFQNPEKQMFATSVYDDIVFPLLINGTDPDTAREKAFKIMRELEIEHLKDEYPYNLSHGEKQRASIAGILVNGAGFLILDEPTTALDKTRKELLGSILKNLHEAGTGILIISHDEKFIKKFCTREIRMNAGEVIENE